MLLLLSYFEAPQEWISRTHLLVHWRQPIVERYRYLIHSQDFLGTVFARSQFDITLRQALGPTCGSCEVVRETRHQPGIAVHFFLPPQSLSSVQNRVWFVEPEEKEMECERKWRFSRQMNLCSEQCRPPLFTMHTVELETVETQENVPKITLSTSKQS